MIQNGAKTNQVFNQVFEYLAEWVDKAGEQITAISDKVDTLDDIGQIKVMLADLKDESQDNSESIELIEALGNVFDKQAKQPQYRYSQQVIDFIYEEIKKNPETILDDLREKLKLKKSGSQP